MPKSVVLLFALAAGSGCTGYQATELVPVNSTPIRVTFSPARDLTGKGPRGDSVVFSDVSEIQGVLIAARQDSILVAVQTLRTVSRSVEVADGTVTSFVRDSASHLAIQSRRSGGRMNPWNAMALILIVGAAVIAALAASRPLG